MKRTPYYPALQALTLAREKDGFTNEGAPPPGIVGTDLPHRRSTGPATLPRVSIMPLTHTAIWLDHHNAHVLQLDDAQTLDDQIRQRIHFTRYHDSHVRSEHEFFGDIAEALAGSARVLVVGPKLEHAALRKYLAIYEPDVCAQIVQWQTEEHPTEHDVIRLAREYFEKDTAAPRFV
jgi:hypothetical protein